MTNAQIADNILAHRQQAADYDLPGIKSYYQQHYYDASGALADLLTDTLAMPPPYCDGCRCHMATEGHVAGNLDSTQCPRHQTSIELYYAAGVK